MLQARVTGVRRRLQELWQKLASDRRWLALGAGLLALVILTDDAGISLGVVLAAALIGIGVMLLQPETAERAEGVTEALPTSRPTRPLVARRPRSKLFLLTLAATFVFMGAAFALDALGVWRIDLGRMTAIPLLVVGGALILGAWWGRSRLLILVGLALVPVVALANIGPIAFPGRIGDIYEAPGSPGHLETSYETMIGSTTIDLTHMRLRGEDLTIPIEFGIGEVDVLVPRRFAVDTSVRLRAGGFYVFGETDSGERLSIDAETFPELANQGTVTLDIQGTAGSVAVEKVWTPPERPERRKEGTRRGDRVERRNDRPRRDDRKSRR